MQYPFSPESFHEEVTHLKGITLKPFIPAQIFEEPQCYMWGSFWGAYNSDNEMIGQINYQINQTSILICDLWVHPLCRKFGIATWMIKNTMKIYEPLGLPFKVEAWESSKSIFENLGFNVVEVRHIMSKQNKSNAETSTYKDLEKE